MSKIKELFNRYREIVMYLIFGVLTTLVGMGSYFIILKSGTALGFSDDNGDPTYALRLTAQVLQWILAVLFAFYTNRKWVFDGAEKSAKPMRVQLVEFGSSRVITLLLDTGVTFGLVWLLDAVNYTQFSIFSKDLIAKCTAAVLVIIGNYVLSKLWVFKKSK